MARVAAHNIAAHAAGDTGRESYLPHVEILCLMDMGNGAAWVSRNQKQATMIPMPIFGHWMKKGWGAYYRLSRQRRLPRLPGM
jgi:sulfide:quinone oxidoreductase